MAHHFACHLSHGHPSGLLTHYSEQFLHEVLATPIAIARNHIGIGVRLGIVPTSETLSRTSRTHDGHCQSILLCIGKNGGEPHEVRCLHGFPLLVLEPDASHHSEPLTVIDLVPVTSEHLTHHGSTHLECLGSLILATIAVAIFAQGDRDSLLLNCLHF